MKMSKKTLFHEKNLLERERKLNVFSLKILDSIRKNWPTNPLEIANELGETGKLKSLSAKYLYQFRKLKELDLIDMKRLGNSYIAWPIDIEKIRVIHELLHGE